MNKKNKKIIYLLILAVYLSALVSRSFVHGIRIYNEFRRGRTEYKPGITPCMHVTSFADYEDLRLFNYRKLGVKCEK
jgi:hypothetical protein